MKVLAILSMLQAFGMVGISFSVEEDGHEALMLIVMAILFASINVPLAGRVLELW